MKFIQLRKVKDGKYLKNYELVYENKAGQEKIYEIVSRRDLKNCRDLGAKSSGVSIIATCGDKMLLLHEFRMAINRYVYNLVAGMINEGETIEECIKRELYEETGLKVERIMDILEPSFSAVAISDLKTNIAFVEVEGEFEDHTSVNEQIEAAFYSKEEVRELLKTAEFSSRCQLAAYYFVK